MGKFSARDGKTEHVEGAEAVHRISDMPMERRVDATGGGKLLECSSLRALAETSSRTGRPTRASARINVSTPFHHSRLAAIPIVVGAPKGRGARRRTGTHEATPRCGGSASLARPGTASSDGIASRPNRAWRARLRHEDRRTRASSSSTGDVSIPSRPLPDARSDVLGQAVRTTRAPEPFPTRARKPRSAVLGVHHVDVPELGPQSDRSDEVALVVDGDHANAGAEHFEPSRKRLGPDDDGHVRSRRNDEGHETLEMCDRPSLIQRRDVRHLHVPDPD